MKDDATIASCPCCGQPNRSAALSPGELAACSRCGTVLRRCAAPGSRGVALALALAGLVLLGLCCTFPLLGLRLRGSMVEMTVPGACLILWQEGQPLLAGLLAWTVVAAPLVELGTSLATLRARAGARVAPSPAVPGWARGVRAWSLPGVFVIGLLVSLVKLEELAAVTTGPALLALGGLVLVLASLRTVLDPLANQHPAQEGRNTPPGVQATWALTLAAALLYVPANLLPVMSVHSMGREQTDTIVSGVVHLASGGQWPLAIIVFAASVVVPLLKLLALTLLLVSVHQRSAWRTMDRARLLRVTEHIGRYSMIDIYVIAALVALVQFGNVARVQVGPAALFFAAVVVLTISAARALDERLLWQPPARGGAHG